MEGKKRFLLFVFIFLVIYWMPLHDPSLSEAVLESLFMLQEYAREHVLFCLIPAFFIAGAIANFISQQQVIKYFGGDAKKWLSYSVASVSGAILAVCSCTVLPLFAGIYKRGAGIGPATAFLYSGPAINILAIILTARVLGWQMGLARALGSIFFALIIGLIMASLFSEEKREGSSLGRGVEEEGRRGWQNLLYFFTLVLILVFAAWGRPEEAGFWYFIYSIKWPMTLILLLLLSLILYLWFEREELLAWVDSTWEFAQQILPLLFFGVMLAGFLMGRPEGEGLIPADWVAYLVGGNTLLSNLTASVLGAFMYFATLTEIPILQGLLGLGMGDGPALALLLAGPALSLPNMLVIRSVLGTKKTLVFILLVVVMSTLCGFFYGLLL